MTHDDNGLARQLAALTDRFADLGARLAQAAKALDESGAPPAPTLVEELGAARSEFASLRAGVLDAAQAFEIPPPAGLESLGDLETLLAAVGEAVQVAARRAAFEEARGRALAVLDAALEIVHRDEPNFAALEACYDKAGEVRAVVTAASSDSEPDALAAAARPFADLLLLLEGGNLDDERYAAVEESISKAFGRGLSIAAARGRLVRGPLPEPEPAPAEPAPAEAPAPALVLETPPVEAAAPTLELEQPAPVLELAEPTPTLELERAPALELEQPAPVLELEPTPTLELERAPALELEQPAVEVEPVAAAAPDEEAASDSSGSDESAQWWVSAWARWTGWKSTLSFGDAVKEELSKYPHLLSVPIQKSVEYEDGLLAYGYSLLIEHVEKQNPGFVARALNSLNTAGGRGKSLGVQLYEYLVAEGRLRESYPDFVKSVLDGAAPDLSFWPKVKIQDMVNETRVFTRPGGRAGETEQSTQRLSAEKQRFTDHRFSVTVEPLTTTFFQVTAGDLKEARGVEVKLQEGGVDSDAAWLLTASPVGKGDVRVDTRRLSADGASFPGLGKDYTSLWVAVFNQDPDAAKGFEVTLSLKKGRGR